MKLRDVVALIDGSVLTTKANIEREVYSAFASDMMSDVLAYVHEQGLLITGLTNPQVVRTAEMMDMLCIVIVRDKRPDQSVIDLANQKNVVVISTKKSTFETAGLLFKAGLKG